MLALYASRREADRRPLERPIRARFEGRQLVLFDFLQVIFIISSAAKFVFFVLFFFLNVFLVCPCRWYKSWERYVGVGGGDQGDSHHVNGGGNSVERPGPIDNSDLIENGNGGDVELRRNLEEEQDYVLVPQQVWEKLFHWYLSVKT